MNTGTSLSRKRKRPSSSSDVVDVASSTSMKSQIEGRHGRRGRRSAEGSETDDAESSATTMSSSEISDDDSEAEMDVGTSSQHHRQYMSDNEEADEMEESGDEQDSEDDENQGNDAAGRISQRASFVGKKSRSSPHRQASIEDELKRIHLKTIAKAQKKLATTQKAKLRPDEAQQADDASSRKQGRRGRDAPRRADTTVDMRPNQARSDGSDRRSDARQEGEQLRSRKAPPVRSDKHAPQEMSSKRAVSRRRTVVDVQGNPTGDPRFDSLGAGRDDRAFQASYGFLSDARRDEINRLKTALKVTKKKHGAVDGAERAAMERELIRLQSTQAQVDKTSREHDSMKAWKQSEQNKRAEGKTPFHLKRAQVKSLIEDERMKAISTDKRKLRKVEMRKVQNERRKSFKSAPPVRAG